MKLLNKYCAVIAIEPLLSIFELIDHHDSTKWQPSSGRKNMPIITMTRNQSWCRICNYSINWTHKQTCNKHINSKHHVSNKKNAEMGSSSSDLSSTPIPVWEWCQCQLKVQINQMMLAIIQGIHCQIHYSWHLLHKAEKLQHFIKKHCKQSGTLAGEDTLGQYHLSKLYDE